MERWKMLRQQWIETIDDCIRKASRTEEVEKDVAELMSKVNWFRETYGVEPTRAVLTMLADFTRDKMPLLPPLFAAPLGKEDFANEGQELFTKLGDFKEKYGTAALVEVLKTAPLKNSGYELVDVKIFEDRMNAFRTSIGQDVGVLRETALEAINNLGQNLVEEAQQRAELQRVYEEERSNNRWWRSWTYVLGVVAVGATLWGFGNYVKNTRLERERIGLEARIEAKYKAEVEGATERAKKLEHDVARFEGASQILAEQKLKLAKEKEETEAKYKQENEALAKKAEEAETKNKQMVEAFNSYKSASDTSIKSKENAYIALEAAASASKTYVEILKKEKVELEAKLERALELEKKQHGFIKEQKKEKEEAEAKYAEAAAKAGADLFEKKKEELEATYKSAISGLNERIRQLEATNKANEQKLQEERKFGEFLKVETDGKIFIKAGLTFKVGNQERVIGLLEDGLFNDPAEFDAVITLEDCFNAYGPEITKRLLAKIRPEVTYFNSKEELKERVEPANYGVFEQLIKSGKVRRFKNRLERIREPYEAWRNQKGEIIALPTTVDVAGEKTIYLQAVFEPEDKK